METERRCEGGKGGQLTSNGTARLFENSCVSNGISELPECASGSLYQVW